MSEPKIESFTVVGGQDYRRASGLIARGYSKLALQPVDLTGAVRDILEGVAALGYQIPLPPEIRSAIGEAGVG